LSTGSFPLARLVSKLAGDYKLRLPFAVLDQRVVLGSYVARSDTRTGI
jgi:hypothetical protein